MKLIRLLIICLLPLFSAHIVAQDILVRTNGAQIDVQIIKITEDSVWFKNKNLYGNPLMSIPTSDVRMIQSWNGEKEYLSGSYKNKSEDGRDTIVSGFESTHKKLLIDDVQYTIENLFTENHLIMDYSYHPDSLLVVSKGKMEFVFENKKNNFFVKFFPIDDKTIVSKFTFTSGTQNKRYDKLTSYNLSSMLIYMNDSVNSVELTEVQSNDLKELFSSKEFR